MSTALSILFGVISFFLFLRNRQLNGEVGYWKERSDEFWKLYCDENKKRMSSIKYIGGKHEFGHDYD